jgi:hypothetical protein
MVYKRGLKQTFSPLLNASAPFPVMSKQIILDFFASGNNKDTDALSAALADDFTGTMLPSSLGIPTMNKEKFTAGAVKFTGSIPDLKVSWLSTCQIAA